MRPLLLFALASLLQAACCTTITAKLTGDKRIFIEVDISPATFSDAFVTLHVDGRRAGVMCPAFSPTDCSSSSGTGASRVSSASTYLSAETQMLPSGWDRPRMIYASVESFFGSHIAFASASASVSSAANLGTRPSTSRLFEENADNSNIMNIVIFSKDRPSQLDLLTRSLKR